MARNEALSTFLTAKRAAVSPAQAGIPTTGARRVPGLRREEVAFLAAVSVDWYVRLEQGRPVTPSESVLDAIAKILQLDDAEREYLFNLARPAAAGGPRDGEQPVRPGIVNMIRAFDRQPAFVLGPRMDVLTGNELAWALLTDFPRRPPGERNLIEWILLDPGPRALYRDWAVIASELVGVLQLEASANPKDPAIAALVGEAVHPQRGVPDLVERPQSADPHRRHQAVRPPRRRRAPHQLGGLHRARPTPTHSVRLQRSRPRIRARPADPRLLASNPTLHIRVSTRQTGDPLHARRLLARQLHHRYPRAT